MSLPLNYLPCDDSRSDGSQLPNLISFRDVGFGYNAGNLFQHYLDCLCENEYLFQSAKRLSKTFSLHNLEETVLFEGVPIGINKSARLIQTLCEIVGKPKLSNQSIRKTGLRILKKLPNEQDF